MDQTEFEALIDHFGDSTKQLVDLVEQARYEQPTAIAISNLLDCREQLLALLAKLPALRSVEAPDAPAATLAPTQDMGDLVRQVRERLRTNSDAAPVHELVRQAERDYAALIRPLEVLGRWPRRRAAR